MSLGGSIRPSEHPVPGAGPLSSRRPRTLARHLEFALNQALGCSGGGQFAITSSIPLSALRPISCLAEAAARQNPHRRQTTRRFPRVRSSEAFGRRPLHPPINHVGPASETLHESGRPASELALGSGAIGCLRLEFGGTVGGNSGPVRGNLAEWPVDGLSAGLRHVNLVLSAPFSHHAGSPRSSLRKWAA